MSCVVVDLGGTHLRCGIVSDRGELFARERTRLDEASSGRDGRIWELIVSRIERFVVEHAGDVERNAPVAFAFPGPVRDDRAAAGAPTVAGSGCVPDIAGQLRARTGRQVMMLNDVSAAAWYFEKRIAAERFVIVTVSSGIGSKIFDRRYGPGVIDDTPYAGEIGHLVVQKDGAESVCDCGGKGHLGAVASGRGFERRAREEARRDAAAFGASACVKTFGATAATLNNEAHLVPAILKGDRWVLRVLQTSIAPLAEVLRILTIGCGLQGVVIMGGFAQQIGGVYGLALSAALGTFSDRGIACVSLENFVTVAGENEEPCLIGAARYAMLRRSGP